ncbi:MAG: DUF1697 domain-containing protein [Erysipelotrichaceae bacterium]|nr:DUF1697 domain-containing protein [Erysipelotrichaceae bacterium]
MKRQIALLRGINISGKNKIAMPELKREFERLGFKDVRTYLNSGNVLFDSETEDAGKLTETIEVMIREHFQLDIPVFVIAIEDLKDILENAPSWWGSDDKAIYDNLIFILPPTDFEEVHSQIGEPKEGLERIMNYRNAVFWSFDLKLHQKTNWWPKTAALPIGSRLTIRTANTVRKLADLQEERK